MQQWKLHGFILGCLFWLQTAQAGGSSSRGAPPRGADPRAHYDYESFRCLDGSSSRVLGPEKINDGYCDCPSDGSDEPGTPACAEGRFYCDAPHIRGISTSLLHDGVCDCCDGSDELGCPNTCAAEQNKRSTALRLQHERRLRGLKKLAELAGPGITLRKTLLKEEAEDAQRLKQASQAMVTLRGEMEKAERPSPQQQQHWNQMKAQAQRLHHRVSRARKLLTIQSDHVLGLVQDCSSSSILSEKVIRGGAVTSVDKHYSFVICPFEFALQRWEYRGRWEYDTCINEIGETAANGTSNNHTCTMRAENAGVNMEQVAQYTKYCGDLEEETQRAPCLKHFNEKMEQQKDHQLQTLLGAFNPSKSNIYKFWVFSDEGEPCSNGQHRQLNASLVCGYTAPSTPQQQQNQQQQQQQPLSRILSVHENGMCEYEMEIETPVACALEDRKQEL